MKKKRVYFDASPSCLAKTETKRVVGDGFPWEYCGEVCRIITGGGTGGNFVGEKKQKKHGGNVSCRYA